MTPLMNGNRALPPARIQSVISPAVDEGSEEQPPTTPLLTQPQTLEGVAVSAGVIDELFRMYIHFKISLKTCSADILRYFEDMHHFLPILDPQLTPNEVYHRSNFLFWAIVGTASRNYDRDPTLLDCVGEKILNLALMTLRYPNVYTIKGLVLIMTWPLPRAAGTTDVTYAISGSLLHMAIQIGLHIPTSSQDFSRVKVNLTEAEIRKRAELWGFCVLTYQRYHADLLFATISIAKTHADLAASKVMLQSR